MSDLISRQALLKALDEEVRVSVKAADKGELMKFMGQVLSVIYNQPTVEKKTV